MTKISKNLLFFILGALVLIGVFVALFITALPKKTAPRSTANKISEITIQNDQVKLKIKRNGLVEISTANRSFYQFWDQDRINRLFGLLEQTDWSKFKSSPTGYLLTVVTDQGTFTVVIPDDLLDLPPGVQELIDILEDMTDSLDDQAGGLPPLPSPSPSPSPAPSSFPSPSPSLLPSPTPTSTPTFFPTPTPDSDRYTPFVCRYTGTTEKIKVLSETLCDLVD